MRALKALLQGPCLILLASACGTTPATSVSPPGGTAAREALPLVQVGSAERILIQRRARAVGQLLADEQIVIRNEMDGKVDRIPVDFGSPVRAGQLLVEFDARDHELAVERVQATLAMSLAALGLSPDASEESLLVDQVPSVALAQAFLEDARTKLESAAQLVKNRDIPEQRYLEAAKTVEQREAALRDARDRVRVQLATVRLERAQLAIQEERLTKTRILAPFDGTVLSREVSPGQYVNKNTNLMTVVREDPLRLRGRVPEGSSRLVRRGLALRFRTDAFPGQWFEAVISDLSPVLDPSTRTLAVEARVPNPSKLLKPGMFASLEVEIDDSTPALMVPEAALYSFAGLTKVFRVDPESKLSELVVETGDRQDGKVELIGAGLREGDRVVISDQQLLQDGMAVRVSGTGD